jgi:PII-like signaling protein
MIGQPAKLLRLYINEQDQYGGKPLYEAIVERCRELRIAGVTVFRALEGFGETAELRHSHLFQSDQPIVITLVEHPDKVERTVPILQEMMSSGLIAVTNADVTYVANGTPVGLP